MKLLSIILVGLLWCSSPLHAQKNSLDSLIGTLGNKLLQEGKAVGLSMGIYHHGKNQFYHFGSTNKKNVELPTEHTLYEIGSITKTFAAFLLAKAVMEGKIRLNDDIRLYLDEKYPNLAYNGQPIRIVHLANTSSGLPDWLPVEPDQLRLAVDDSAAVLRARIYGKLTKKDFFAALHHIKPDTIPGSRTHHSNAAAQLLGYILEKVYQQSFEQLIQQNITQPFQLRETSFSIPSANSHKKATGYTQSGNAALAFDLPYFYSVGGLTSSVSDMLTYARLLLDTTQPLFKKVQQRTIVVDAGNGKTTPYTSASVINETVYAIGLNWLLYQYGTGRTQIWSDGGTSGFCSYLVIYPELDAAVVLLTNTSNEKIFRTLPGIASQVAHYIDNR